MAAPIRFLSGRQQQQKIGIEGSTQDEKVLEVVGRVGIGTTIFDPSKQLDVRGDVIVSGELTVGDTTFGIDFSTRNLSVSGVSTFTGAIDANGDLDVDGHTELDDVNVSGVSTFAGAADFNSDIDVDGHTELDDLNVSGVSTFAGAIDANGNLDVDGQTELDDVNISGILTATTLNVTGGGAGSQANLTNLNVSGISTFVGFSTFNDYVDIQDGLRVTGVSTFTGTIDANGDIDVDGHTELDDLNVSGVSTFTGVIDANGDLDVDGHTELDDLNVSGVSTFAGAIDANGDLDVDGRTELDTTNISETLNVVGISTFGSDVDINASIDVDGHTELDDLNVSGVSTFASAVDINASIDVDGQTELDDLNVSGVSTFTGTADFNGDIDVDGHTELDDLNVSGVSTFAGAADFNGDIDVDGHTELDDLNVSGVSTFAGAADFNGDIDVDGHTELDNLNVSGVSTFVGVGTFQSDLYVGGALYVSGSTLGDDIETRNISVSGLSTFTGAADFNGNVDVDGHTELDNLNVSGVSTFAGAADFNGNVDIDGHTELDDVNVSGAITATTFSGDLSGNAGTATALETARTFQITGDVVASAISFDGTGNVSLAATIQPNSVDLGTDTTGDYVESISGTANEIEVTSGTGEGSTPTIGFVANPTIGGNVTIGQDLQVNRNLNVTGNITIGGTTGYILVDTFRVSDADIVLGFTTDSSGEDVSNDTTANHGGVAIASTEGSPLVNLNIAGIETLAPTYKKIMWFKTNAFAGLNTDAWLSNYAFGVGTTSMSSGTKFAVGNIELDFDDITAVRNINSTGVGTFTTLDIGTGGIDVDGHTELDNVNVSGVITATTFVGSVEVPSGGSISGTATTATNIAGGDTGDIPYQSATNTTTFLDASVASVGQVLLWTGSAPSWAYVSAASGNFGGATVQDEGSIVGTAGSVGTFNFVGTNIQATATTGESGIATITVSDTPTFSSLNVSGISTIPSVTGPTTFTGGDVNVGTAITFDPVSGIISATAFYGSGENLTDLINQRIEGLRVLDEGVQIGTGYTFASLNFVGDGVTVTATGIGTTATITIPGFTSDADENLFAGTCAGGTYDPSSGTACFNIFLGSCAGRCITDGDNNVFLGKNAGWNNASGTNNVFIGQDTGCCNTAHNNIFIGSDAGRVNDTGACNTFLGKNAGRCNTTGSFNTFLGSNAGYCNTTGSDNLYLGCQAGYCGNASTSCQNIFLGTRAGYGNTTGCYNVAIGYQAGHNVDRFGNNVFIGCNAGCRAQSGTSGSVYDNVFLGTLSGSTACNTTGSVLIGVQAGTCSCCSNKNVYVGYGAGFNACCSGCSIAIGQYAGYCNQGDDNIFLGRYAGPTFSASGPETGNRNIYLGYAAGCANANSGCCNVIIGQSVQPSTLNGSSQLEIGSGTNRWIAGDSSFNVTVANKLQVNASGIVTASSGSITYYGDGSGLTNVNADTLDGVDSTSFLRSDAQDNKTSGDLIFNDGVKLMFGTSEDLKIQHDSANSYISQEGTGNLFIRNTTDDQDVAIQSDDGSGSVVDYFRADGSTGEAMLYHYGTEKLATKSNGIAISGILTASSGIVTYYGDGSNLTNLPPSGVVPTENTTNQAQFIPFFTGTASTSIAGISSATLVFNPSTNRLGVGTDSPQATLHVVDEFLVSTAGAASTQRISQKAYTTDNGTLSWEGSAGQLFSITNNLTSGSIFSVNDVSGIPSIDVDADGTIQLAPFGSTEFVGVGTTNPTAKLHVVGGVNVTGVVTATDFNSTSDARLKTNVQTIDDPLEKVLQINGVSFNWIENNKPSMGVIADNIQEVLPELVSDTNPKTVNYNGLIGLLIEVVKEQQTQINSLNERLSRLE